MQRHFLPWRIHEDEPDGNGKEKSAVWKLSPRKVAMVTGITDSLYAFIRWASLEDPGAVVAMMAAMMFVNRGMKVC